MMVDMHDREDGPRDSRAVRQRARRRTSPIKVLQPAVPVGTRQRVTTDAFPPFDLMEGHGLVHVFTPLPRTDDSINDKSRTPWWQLDEQLLSRLDWETTIGACKPTQGLQEAVHELELLSPATIYDDYASLHHHYDHQGEELGIQLQTTPCGMAPADPAIPARNCMQMDSHGEGYSEPLVSRRHQGLPVVQEQAVGAGSSAATSVSLQPRPSSCSMSQASNVAEQNPEIYAGRLDRLKGPSQGGMPHGAASTEAGRQPRLFHLPDEECKGLLRQQMLATVSRQDAPHMPAPPPVVAWDALQPERQHIINVACTALKLHMMQRPASLQPASNVHSARVVTLAGLPGVGKGTTMRHTASVLLERAAGTESRTAPGWQEAYYTDLQHAADVESACREILAALGAAPNCLPGPAGWRHLLCSWLQAKHAHLERTFGSLPDAVDTWSDEHHEDVTFTYQARSKVPVPQPPPWKGWWGLLLDGADALDTKSFDWLLESITLACPSVQLIVSHSTWGCSASAPFSSIMDTQAVHTCAIYERHWKQGVTVSTAWVPSLSEAEAWQLFSSITAVSRSNRNLAKQLCAACAGLPRAVVMLAKLQGWDGAQPPPHVTELLPRIARLAPACKGTAPDAASNEMSTWRTDEYEVLPMTSDVLQTPRDQYHGQVLAACQLCKLVTHVILMCLPAQVMCALEALASFTTGWCDVPTARALVEAPNASQVHLAGSASQVLSRLRELGVISWHPGSRSYISEPAGYRAFLNAKPYSSATPRDAPCDMPMPSTDLFGSLYSPRGRDDVSVAGSMDEFAVLRRERGTLAAHQGPACVMVTSCTRELLHEELALGPDTVQAYQDWLCVDADQTVEASSSQSPCRAEARMRGLSAALAGTPWLMSTASCHIPGSPGASSDQATVAVQDAESASASRAGMDGLGVGSLLLSAAREYHSPNWAPSLPHIYSCVRRLQVMLDYCHNCPHLGQHLPKEAAASLADAVWQLRDVLPQVLQQRHLQDLVMCLKAWARSCMAQSMAAASIFVRMDLMLCHSDGRSAALQLSSREAQDAITSMAAMLDQEEHDRACAANTSPTSVSESSPDDLHAIEKTLRSHASQAVPRDADEATALRSKVMSAVQGLSRGVKALVRLHGHSHAHTMSALTMYVGLLGSQSHAASKPPCSKAFGLLARSADDIPALLKAWDACSLAADSSVCAQDAQGDIMQVSAAGSDEKLHQGCTDPAGAHEQAEYLSLMILEAVTLKHTPKGCPGGSISATGQYQLYKSAAEAHGFMAELRMQQGCWEMALPHWQACQQLWASLLMPTHDGNRQSSTPLSVTSTSHPQLVYVRSQLIRCWSALKQWGTASQMCEEQAVDLINQTFGPQHITGIQAVLAQVAAHLHVSQDCDCTSSDAEGTAEPQHPDHETQALIQCTRLLGMCEWIMEQQPFVGMYQDSCSGTQQVRPNEWQLCQALECRADLLRLQAMTLKALCQDTQALQALDSAVAALQHALDCAHNILQTAASNSQGPSRPATGAITCSPGMSESSPVCLSWSSENWPVSLLNKLAAVHESRGSILQDLARYPSAQTAYRWALHFRVRAAGPHHPSVVHTLILMADGHMASSRPLPAMQMYTSAYHLLHQHMLRIPGVQAVKGRPQTGLNTADSTQSIDADAAAHPCMASCISLKAELHLRMSKALQQHELLQQAAQHAQHAVDLHTSLLAACTAKATGTAPELSGPYSHLFDRLNIPVYETHQDTAQQAVQLCISSAHLQLASVMEEFGDADNAMQQYRFVCSAAHVDPQTLTRAHLGVARVSQKLQRPVSPSQSLEEALAFLSTTVPGRKPCDGGTAKAADSDGPGRSRAHGTACVVVVHPGSHPDVPAQHSTPLVWSSKANLNASTTSHATKCLMLLRSKCESRVLIQKAQLVDSMTRYWLSCDQPDSALQAAYKALAMKLNAWQLISSALHQPMELCGSPRRHNTAWSGTHKQALDLVSAWEAPTECSSSGMQAAARLEVSRSLVNLARAHASRGHIDDAVQCIHHAWDWDPYSAAAAGVGTLNQLSSHHQMDMLPRTAHLHALMGQIIQLQGAPSRLAQAHLTAALAVFNKAYGRDHELVASTCLDLAEVLLQPLVHPSHGAAVMNSLSARAVLEGRKLLLRGAHWLKSKYGVQDVRVARTALSLSAVALHWDGYVDKAELLAESAIDSLTCLVSGLYHTPPSAWFSTNTATSLASNQHHSPVPTPDTTSGATGPAVLALDHHTQVNTLPRDSAVAAHGARASHAGQCVASWQAGMGGPDRLYEMVMMHVGGPGLSGAQVHANVVSGTDAQEEWQQVEQRQHTHVPGQAPAHQGSKCPIPRAIIGTLLLTGRAQLLHATIKERRGMFSVAADSYKNALGYFQYVVTASELSAGLMPSPAAREPHAAHEWAWTSSSIIAQPMGALIAQALSGLARLQVGIYLAVPSYKQGPAVGDLLAEKLRTFSMNLGDLVFNESTPTAHHHTARHGTASQGTRASLEHGQHQHPGAVQGLGSRKEGLSLAGLLCTRLGSAHGISARRHAKQALWMLEQSVRLCQLEDTCCTCHLHQVLAMQCAQSLVLVASGGPDAFKKAEALARRVLADIKTLPGHQAVGGWTVSEADVQLVLSAILCADAQSCKEALAVTSTTPSAQQDAKQPSHKCRQPKLHHRLLAQLSGVEVQPGTTYSAAEAASYTQLYGDQERSSGQPDDIQCSSAQAGFKTSPQDVRPVQHPTVVLMLGNGRATSARPTVTQSLSASATSQGHKALEAARAAYRLRFETYGSTSEHTVEALAQLAHVTSVFTQRWTIIEAVYKSVLDAMMLPSYAHKLWERPHAAIALSTLVDATASAAVAGHVPSAAQLVTHYLSVVGVKPKDAAASSSDAEEVVVADGFGNVEATGAVQLQALHARILQLSKGAIKESDEVLVDLCEEAPPVKASWWKRLLMRKPKPGVQGMSKVAQQAACKPSQIATEQAYGPAELKYLKPSGDAEEESWTGVVGGHRLDAV